MKAVIFEKPGQSTEVLKWTETSINNPAPEEVQIRIMARPINPSDEMFIQGVYRQKPIFPQTAGLEGAGIIEKCGAAINKDVIGRHVAFRARGTWAEKINLKLSQFNFVPQSIPFETACQLTLNAVTAFALVEQATLAAGDWLLVTAANSSVCRQIIQIARQRALRVIAVVRKDEHIASLQDLGAEIVLNSEHQNIEDEVKKATEKGVNTILDAVGGPLGTIMFNVVAPYGKIIIYGRLSPEATHFFYGDVIYKNLKIEGFGIDQWLSTKSKDDIDILWKSIVELVSSHALEVKHDRVFELQRFKEALDYYHRTGHRVILQ